DAHLNHGKREIHLRSDRIPIQHIAPARQITPPSAMPTGQPYRSLTQGVTTGASKPPPLPPVFMIAAAVPLKLPPVSTIVDQNAPSAAPTAPSAKLNQNTIQIGDFANTPQPSSSAPSAIPAIGTSDRCLDRSESHPPIGMHNAIVNGGRPA